jgi:hypothetical protein
VRFFFLSFIDTLLRALTSVTVLCRMGDDDEKRKVCVVTFRSFLLRLVVVSDLHHFFPSSRTSVTGRSRTLVGSATSVRSTVRLACVPLLCSSKLICSCVPSVDGSL